MINLGRINRRPPTPAGRPSSGLDRSIRSADSDSASRRDVRAGMVGTRRDPPGSCREAAETRREAAGTPPGNFPDSPGLAGTPRDAAMFGVRLCGPPAASPPGDRPEPSDRQPATPRLIGLHSDTIPPRRADRRSRNPPSSADRRVPRAGCRGSPRALPGIF